MQPAPKLRSDFDRIRSSRGETRSPDRLAAHYEVESRLARQLAESNREERSRLYSAVYHELFEALPDHPQHHGSRTIRLDRVRAQSAWLSKWLGANSTYVEIGCGDAALTKVLAGSVSLAIGVDVTPILVSGDQPETFQFLLSDGINLDIPSGTIDVVFSNQLMEHLHAADALAQLQEIYRILKPGGRYICCTPNRLSGPHDISVYFGHSPTGFHMREYDHRSLSSIFRSVGFRSVHAHVQFKGIFLQLPVALMQGVENFLELLPAKPRAGLSHNKQVANLLGLTLAGIK